MVHLREMTKFPLASQGAHRVSRALLGTQVILAVGVLRMRGCSGLNLFRASNAPDPHWPFFLGPSSCLAGVVGRPVETFRAIWVEPRVNGFEGHSRKDSGFGRLRSVWNSHIRNLNKKGGPPSKGGSFLHKTGDKNHAYGQRLNTSGPAERVLTNGFRKEPIW